MSAVELINTFGVPMAVLVLLLDKVIALVKARVGGGHSQASGELSPSEWEARIRAVFEASLAKTTERQIDMLQAALSALNLLNEKMAVLIDRTPRRGGKAHE